MKARENVKRGALQSVYSVLFMLILMMSAVFNTSCESETAKPMSNIVVRDTIEVIRDLYYDSERTLTVIPSVKDTLVKSDVTFTQKATFNNEKEGILMSLTPEAYLNVRLSEQRINVKSADELPFTVVREYISSQSPYHSGSIYGEDFVKIFEGSDGQRATVSYGYRYMAVVVGTDTLATPHAEIKSVTFNKQILDQFEQKTETEDPYRSTLVFDAEVVTKGVSGQQTTSSVSMKPWYRKVITTDAVEVKNVEYSGQFVGCPYSAYELTEKVTTNKSTFTNTYSVNVSVSLTAPVLREQPSLDSLFKAQSTGKFAQQQLSEIKNADGFTVRTMTGTYVSSNTGTERQTAVESTVSFTYQFPVKFESSYGSYVIPEQKLSFEELGFSVVKISEDEDSKLFKSVNSIQGKAGDCTMDVIDEVVNLRMQKAKAPDVIEVDSIYTLTGSGDDYDVDKEIIWSDGTRTHYSYSYTGRHQAAAKSFGEVITSSLNWTENALNRTSQTTSTEEKKFSSTTKFTATYTTSVWQSNATNGKESGVFAFTEMSPVVVFTDGNITKTFPERKYTLNGLGADVASNYNVVVRNGVSYKAYDYDYHAAASFNGGSAESLVSDGLLLMQADESGTPTYSFDESWSGNTATLKVIKTTPHTYAEDEVETYTQNFTVGLTSLTDGQLYADNTNFAATGTSSESNNTTTDTPWTVQTYKRVFTYTLTNGVVKRSDLVTEVTDGVVTFNNGEYAHTFDLRMNVSKTESFGTARQSGNYTVTPHLLTVTAVTGTKSLTTTGTTDIYVKRTAEVTGHTEKTIVYPDGTVDAEVKITKDDGTSETIKASDTFGKRFAFNFANTSPQEKVVTNVNHQASGSVGTATTTTHKQGQWTVTEYRYPYTHVLDNGVATDKVSSAYGYSNFEFAYTDANVGTVKLPMPTVNMVNTSLNIVASGTANGYINHNAKVVVTGNAAGTEGTYNQVMAVIHVLKVADNGGGTGDEPQQPNFGKPKNFTVTATFDPGSNVTRRAFVFVWETGVTYAVCNYETMLPSSSDFMYKKDSYSEYNSVGYDKSNTSHWQPARGTDSSDALRWYNSSGTLISAIDKALTCKVIGWKNIVSGSYALVIPGYTYTTDGYNITVTAPDGQKVTFNSHYTE